MGVELGAIEIDKEPKILYDENPVGTYTSFLRVYIFDEDGNYVSQNDTDLDGGSYTVLGASLFLI